MKKKKKQTHKSIQYLSSWLGCGELVHLCDKYVLWVQNVSDIKGVKFLVLTVSVFTL